MSKKMVSFRIEEDDFIKFKINLLKNKSTVTKHIGEHIREYNRKENDKR